MFGKVNRDFLENVKYKDPWISISRPSLDGNFIREIDHNAVLSSSKDKTMFEGLAEYIRKLLRKF